MPSPTPPRGRHATGTPQVNATLNFTLTSRVTRVRLIVQPGLNCNETGVHCTAVQACVQRLKCKKCIVIVARYVRSRGYMRRTTSRREVNRQSHGERSPGRRAIPRRIPSVTLGLATYRPDTHKTYSQRHNTHVWSHRLLAPTAPVPNTGQVAMANVSEAAREAAMAASRS